MAAPNSPGKVRARRRAANGTVVSEANAVGQEDEQDYVAPDTARLREVLSMLVAGRTQTEIAAHFRKSTRTIRRWIAEATRRRIETFKGLSPHDLLSGTFYKFAQLEARLIARLVRAEAENDERAVEAYIRQLRVLERDKYVILQKIGFFEGVTMRPNIEPDPAQRDAELLQRLARDFLSGRGSEEIPEIKNAPCSAGQDGNPEPLF